MSVNLPLPAGSEPSLPVPTDGYAVQHHDPAMYGGAPAPQSEDEQSSANLTRIGSALSRYRWMIAGFTLMGLAGGIVATRFINAQYEVNATIVTTSQGPTGVASPGPLAGNFGWRDLLKTFTISDPVVQKLSLYLQPDKAADSLLFTNFTLDPTKPRFQPGKYTLKTEAGHFTLRDDLGIVNEVGTVGDSIGRVAGFAWVPSARLLGTRSRTVDFKVMTPREASRDVLKRFDVGIQQNSPVITLKLTGNAEQRPAATLNAMLTRFVDVASELKKRELVQQSATLATQLDESQRRLQDAERALEEFRVATISKPSETPTYIAPGGANAVAEVAQPVFNSYFIQKAELDGLRRDRESLERLSQQIQSQTSTTAPEAIFSIPTVARDEGAAALKQSIGELGQKEAKLRNDLQLMTDSNLTIKAERRDIADLRGRVVPQQLSNYISTLRTRQTQLASQLDTATTELRGIPQRSIQQGALERERTVAAETYTKLRSAYAQANLAQQASIPDVKILDSAVTPLEPTSNTAPRIIGFGLLLGIGLGVGLAILLDRLDKRFRYLDQAKSELGLEVLGVVPVVDQSGRQSPEAVAQIVEAFRSIRMNLRYASGSDRGVVFGITSPDAGDGKSLIASNLALSFAEGGWRTVLVDADARRGQLSTTFDVPQSPGLVEYLEGTSLMSEVLHATTHDNLTMMPSGTRHRRAPELLAMPRMQQLVAALGMEFDVVIIDTPPLGAGTDAYAVGTACRQLAIVLRSDRTNLKMAKAKLGVLNQLPISILGAILNEVRSDSGMYQYYSYDMDYALPEEVPALAGGGNSVVVRNS